jgi:copper(I)-binding protein
MKNLTFTLILSAILLTACSASSEGTGEETGIEVHQVTVTEAAQGENSELYMALHNHGSATDQLIGVTSDAAGGAELHNGTEVVEDIPVYANTDLDFTPEGYHVVLTGLKQELHHGDEIQVVLQFRDHDDMTITATVGESTEHQDEHQEGS